METILDLAVTFWQWTIVIAVIAVSYVINKLDKPDLKRINFEYTTMPKMQPLPIKTASKGFWGAIWMWLTGVRQWVITEDFHYWIDNQAYKIPAGFQFDGASVPKFLRTSSNKCFVDKDRISQTTIVFFIQPCKKVKTLSS